LPTYLPLVPVSRDIFLERDCNNCSLLLTQITPLHRTRNQETLVISRYFSVRERTGMHPKRKKCVQCVREKRKQISNVYRRSLPLPSPSSFARCTPSVTEEVQTSHQTVRSNIIITQTFTEMCLVPVLCRLCFIERVASPPFRASADLKRNGGIWPER
jgi:hypothetical protein